MASVIGLHGGAHRATVSGALDGLGDAVADPLGLVGKEVRAAHSVEGMGGALGQVYQGTSITAENVDQAFNTLPSIRERSRRHRRHDTRNIAVRYPSSSRSS